MPLLKVLAEVWETKPPLAQSAVFYESDHGTGIAIFREKVSKGQG
jgi:hypothetical protein